MEKTKLEQIRNLKLQICSKEQEINSLKRQIETLENETTEVERYRELYNGKVVQITPTINSDNVTSYMHIVDVDKVINENVYVTVDLFIVHIYGYSYKFYFDKLKKSFCMDDISLNILTNEEYSDILDKAPDDVKEQCLAHTKTKVEKDEE